MFESVSPDLTAVRQGRSRFYKSLPASLLFHGLVLLAVPIGASWKVEFPANSPRLIAPYNLVEAPPPPPPPPPPPAAPRAQTVPVVQPVVPDEIVAPTVIPEEIPVVTETVASAPELVAESVEDGVEGGVEGGVAGGVVGGTPEGVIGGVIGGTPGGVVTGPVVDDRGRVVIPRDEKLDLFPVSQDYPIYPWRAQKAGWEDTLVVRYVIGRNGSVKDVTVIVPADRKMFDDVAVEAIRHWRFRPMIKDGQRVEVVHELTVRFRLMDQHASSGR